MYNLHVSKAKRYHKIESYTSYIVEEYAIKRHGSYSLPITEIPDLELNTLTNLYIDYYDREISYIMDDDVASALISFLKEDNRQNQDVLIELIRDKTIQLYRQEMESMIEEQCNEYEKIKSEKPLDYLCDEECI